MRYSCGNCKNNNEVPAGVNFFTCHSCKRLNSLSPEVIKTSKKTQKIGVIISLIPLIIFGYILLKINSCNQTISKEVKQTEIQRKTNPTEDQIKNSAIASARVYVKQNLKSPSTADFPWSGETVTIEDNIYTVKGYVDAQNSFGAKERMNYICKLKFDGPSDEDLSIISLITDHD